MSAIRLAVCGLAVVATAYGATDPAGFFRQNCANCHTIGGGRLTGPDLKNVTTRADRDWLVSFILNPKAKIDSGDPYAVKLKQESRDVVMPSIPTLTPELAAMLLDLIDTESQLAQSQFVGLAVSDEPFTPAQISMGAGLFIGKRRLTGGGAPCLSCHTLYGLKGLSGGRLGPDLTRVFERLQGRRSLASWLNAPATPTMQAVFSGHPLTPDEVLALTAFFEETARRGGQDNSPSALNFFLLGLVGALFVLAVMEALWKGRFVSVRRVQVEASQLRTDRVYPAVKRLQALESSQTSRKENL